MPGLLCVLSKCPLHPGQCAVNATPRVTQGPAPPASHLMTELKVWSQEQIPDVRAIAGGKEQTEQTQIWSE